MKPEGRFKQRTHRSAKRVAKAAGIELEYGQAAGDPDQIYKFGHVWIACEHKRQGKKPRVLQEHRLEALRQLGLPGFSIAAQEDQFKEEKQAFYEALLSCVGAEAVDDHVRVYRHQAGQLREALEELIND